MKARILTNTTGMCRGVGWLAVNPTVWFWLVYEGPPEGGGLIGGCIELSQNKYPREFTK
ncbi:MAG TPA: hypothetical protein VFR80_15415 [Pyrinomonadaceae bacterium]|nr:hypothetical protein [Pyrinomonadaceae bacterium]